MTNIDGKEQQRHDSCGLHLIIHQHGHHLPSRKQHNTNINKSIKRIKQNIQNKIWLC